jgi:hypothetical protein
MPNLGGGDMSRRSCLQLLWRNTRAFRRGNAFAVVMTLLAIGSAHQLLWPASGIAKPRSPAPDPSNCLVSLPVKTPQAGAHRVIQLVNCSNQVLLGAANGAYRAGEPSTAVFPREGTWVMQSYDRSKPYNQTLPNPNILTIDIPREWEDTSPAGSLGPRFWARTGCRYDIASDRAQCETGGCGGTYDCSKANLADVGATTLSEWTFYQKVSSGGISYFKDSPDISAVDGVNLTIDIQQVNGSATDPFDALGGHSINWLAENTPLTQHGQDLRATCIPSFQLKRSDMTSGILGFVMIGNDGQPLGGDYPVACFSNCGKYKFVVTPSSGCDPTKADYQKCLYLYETFCLFLDASAYGGTCQTDNGAGGTQGCYFNGINYGISCYKDGPKGPSATNGQCAGRGFIAQKSCPGSVCTYPYGYVDPTNGQQYYSTQPAYAQCSDVTGDTTACIGDDTIHVVMPKAYSWPNDPQVFIGDAPLYRVIFSPGGTPANAPPITPSGPIPNCSQLPSIYDIPTQFKSCQQYVSKSVFAVAQPKTAQNPNWACVLPEGDSGDNGVICRWKAPGLSQRPPGRGRAR